MLTRDLLKKIRKIEIVTERLVRDRMAGQYHSVFKGSGIAFSEVRQYMPGDDIRLIDWNVSARMNDTYVKLFTEEREMTVLLLVDMSASGRFGSRVQEKRELGAEIAAVLAFSAIRNNDRVGLVIFTDDVEHFVPPKKGKKHVLRVISEILAFEPRSRRTNLARALQFLGRIARRRAGARAPPGGGGAVFRAVRQGRPAVQPQKAVPAGADVVLRGAGAEAAALRRRLLRTALGAGLVFVVVIVVTGAPARTRAAVVDAPDAGAVDPDAPTVAARLQAPDKVHVGDAITLVVTAISRRNAPVNLPGALDLGAFSVLDHKDGEQDLGDGRVRHEFTITIAAYEPGEKEVPAVQVTYLGGRGDVRTARTAPLPVKLTS